MKMLFEEQLTQDTAIVDATRTHVSETLSVLGQPHLAYNCVRHGLYSDNPI